MLYFYLTERRAASQLLPTCIHPTSSARSCSASQLAGHLAFLAVRARATGVVGASVGWLEVVDGDADDVAVWGPGALVDGFFALPAARVRRLDEEPRDATAWFGEPECAVRGEELGGKVEQRGDVFLFVEDVRCKEEV